MFSTTIQAGDVYVHRIAGGGGLGDPLERDPTRSRVDVANEKVCVEAARGAVRRRPRARRRVDVDATERLRAETEERGHVIEKADAVVIGGGIMGASTAHFLTKLGFGRRRARREAEPRARLDAVLGRPRPPALLERGRDPARRSRGAGCSRTPRRSSAATSASCRSGTCCSRPPRTSRRCARSSRSSRSSASRPALLTPDEVVERWPELELEGIELACYEETSGCADPVRTVESLARSASAIGASTSTRAARCSGITASGGARHRGRHGRGRDLHRRRRQRDRAVGEHDRADGRRRVPDHVQPRARGDLPSAGGLPRPAGDVGLRPAALLPLRSARTRCSSARAGRRSPSRPTPRRTTPAPTTRTCARMVPKLLRRLPALRATLAAGLRRRVRDGVLRRLRHHR